MRKTLICTILFFNTICISAQNKINAGYPITPVPFTSVKVTDNFWGQRLKASREVTIPLAFSKCEETGRYENFVKAANPSSEYKVGGFSFDDTDVYKTIEGASYSMETYPNKKIEKYIDSLLLIISKAQEPDGYLFTSRTMNPAHPHEWAGNKRWEKEEDLSHELYNLGHMIEGAVAHYQATGKKSFLDIAIRYADCAIREVGEAPGQVVVVPGHQIPEMALAKLYTITGDKKYLDFAKFLLDKRGYTTIKHEYSQAHKPVLEQDEAVGHAVRATYMYSGIADVAALTGDTAYISAIDKIWDNVVSKKLYITGGIGATSHGEAFGKNYELPNMSAYNETCAAIANVYWNYRLFLLHGDSKYYDVLERSLYNGLISGVSLDGGSFFYPNPLESQGQHERQPWFGCACCPSNIARFMSSLPGYVYAVKDNSIYVNLYMSNTAELDIDGKKIELTQTSGYPWDGNNTIEINTSLKKNFTLKLRLPGWLKGEVVPSDLYRYMDGKQLGYKLQVNGKDVNYTLDKGYLCIDRKWNKGDKIELNFDMAPRLVKANNKVEADRGRVSVERGPIVYCAEWADNDFKILTTLLPDNPSFDVVDKPELLYGIKELKTKAQSLTYDSDGLLQTKNEALTLIPYYAWAHRGTGDMTVWLPQEVNASRPQKQSSIVGKIKIDASQPEKTLYCINDGVLPQNENDRSVLHYNLRNNNSPEWITYEFETPQQISSSSVYWFDDAPWGGTRIPKSWKIYYKDDSGQWKDVENTSDYPIIKGMNNKVTFEPITTKSMKLEVLLPEKTHAGIYQWSVQ